MTTIDHEKEVITCMEKEYKLYIKLAYLSIQFKNTVIHIDNLPVIEGILSDKTYLIEELEKISGISKGLIISSGVHTDLISQFIVKIREIILKIIEYEKECETKLLEVKQGIGDQLLQVNKGLQLANISPKGFKPPASLSIKS